MARVIEGQNSGAGKSFAVVASRFNEFITKQLLDGALNELRRSGVCESSIEVVWVPGAFEIPLAVQLIADQKQKNGIVAIGCIIRGETSHYDQLAQSLSTGLLHVSISHQIPVGFGVLTVENMQQAIDRAGGKIGNKGRDAARSVIEMVHVVEAAHSGQKKAAIEEIMRREIQQ